MTDFFDQICRVLEENGKKRPGSVADGEEVRRFFSEVEKIPVTDPAESGTVKRSEVPAAPERAEQEVVPERKAVPVFSGDPQEALGQLRAELGDCRRCPLAGGRTNIVFGEGNPQAKLMFIGEAPGNDEDIQGRPFVGKAGQLLDKMITAMQFSREEVYIANVVKCRPQGNRNPMPEEIVKCIGCLKQQIAIIRPEVIVVLGATAAKALLDCQEGISRLRGKWCSYENIPVMPTFHPAFLLRQESAKKEAWQDLQQVMARFGKYHRR